MVTQSGANLAAGSSPRTLEIWYRSSNASPAWLMVYGDLAGNHNFGLYNPNNGTLRIYADGGSYVELTPTHALFDGAWHLLDVTYDGTVAELYLDGLFDDAAATDIYTLSPTRRSSDLSGVGDYDEFAAYGATLTPTQIAVHF